MKNIGVIGQGFVGSAIRAGLEPYYNMLTYDIDATSSPSQARAVDCSSPSVSAIAPDAGVIPNTVPRRGCSVGRGWSTNRRSARSRSTDCDVLIE